MKHLLVALTLALALPAGTAAANEGPSDEIPDTAIVKVVVQNGDETLRHPGLEAYMGEETEFEMRVGKTKHVVVVFADKVGDDKFKVKLTYKRNGKTITSGDLDLKTKKPAAISKGKTKVTVMIDPNGRIGGKEKIEAPKGDDPLDGAPGK